MPEDDAYRAAHLEDTLARDARVHEPELRVEVRGSRVRVSGVVPTRERQAAVTSVLEEQAPGLEVENLTTVIDPAGVPSVERLT